jgi:hypothetical protein
LFRYANEEAALINSQSGSCIDSYIANQQAAFTGSEKRNIPIDVLSVLRGKKAAVLHPHPDQRLAFCS